MFDPSHYSPERIAFVGDVHGQSYATADIIKYCGEKGVSFVIQLGDFGYKFQPWFLQAVSSELVAQGVLMLFIPGNHDDREYLRRCAQGVPPDEPFRVADNLWCLPAGYRWEWRGVSFVALGGAHSIDRAFREMYISMWPDEEISAADAEKTVAGGHADVMITHDCPSGIDIPGLIQPGGPHPKMVVTLDREIPAAQQHRELLRRIVDVVQPFESWCGHYHVRHDETLCGDGYQTRVHIMDQCGVISGMPFERVCDVVSLADLVARVDNARMSQGEKA